MDIPPLEAHGVAEAHLYLMATPCKLCGTGRTRYLSGRLDAAPPPHLLTLQTRCEGCGFETEFGFSLPEAPTSTSGEGASRVAARINPSPDPSRIIDVAQWLTLFRVISEAAASQTDAAETRRLGYEAAQCLEEALKFYHEDNDLPPSEAMFREHSRRQLAEHPEFFARTRLINLRAKLPTLTDMERRLQAPAQERPRKWWKLW